jgi:uncharacterized phage-associated protein
MLPEASATLTASKNMTLPNYVYYIFAVFLLSHEKKTIRSLIEIWQPPGSAAGAQLNCAMPEES